MALSRDRRTRKVPPTMDEWQKQKKRAARGPKRYGLKLTYMVRRPFTRTKYYETPEQRDEAMIGIEKSTSWCKIKLEKCDRTKDAAEAEASRWRKKQSDQVTPVTTALRAGPVSKRA